MAEIQRDLVISDVAASRLMYSHKAIGRIMICLNKGEWTVKTYAKDRSPKLVLPEIVSILEEELGLTRDEILVPGGKLIRQKSTAA